MNDLKILILVLSVNDEDLYSLFLNEQLSTWDSIHVNGIETYYYFGNSNIEKIDSNKIFLKIKESFQNCGHKTIRCFQLIENLDFDYIFRTNSSSYVDKNFLYEYLLNKPRIEFYSGVIGDFNGIKFASGSGYFLSKDLVKIIVKKSYNWEHEFIDDVALGLLLKNEGIVPQAAPRIDIQTKNIFNFYFKKIPMNFFHYRLKSKNRLFDIWHMKKIFKLKQNVNYR